MAATVPASVMIDQAREIETLKRENSMLREALAEMAALAHTTHDIETGPFWPMMYTQTPWRECEDLRCENAAALVRGK